MPSWVIALLFAVGVSTWVYAKFMRKSGNNGQSSLVGSAIVGVVAFVFMMIVLSVITGMLTN